MVPYIGQTVLWGASKSAPGRAWHVGFVQAFERGRATIAIMPSGNGIPFRVADGVVYHTDPTSDTRPDREKGVWRELVPNTQVAESPSNTLALELKCSQLERRLADFEAAELVVRLSAIEGNYARNAPGWTEAIAGILSRLTAAGA